MKGAIMFKYFICFYILPNIAFAARNTNYVKLFFDRFCAAAILGGIILIVGKIIEFIGKKATNEIKKFYEEDNSTKKIEITKKDKE